MAKTNGRDCFDCNQGPTSAIENGENDCESIGYFFQPLTHPSRSPLQMERQQQRQSPITELIRNSVEKVGVKLAPEKRRVSRQILTDMNIAQLQVIVNDMHSHIATLNEALVRYLLERDELHMSQDSMLVDIEDMTKYL